MIRLRPLWALCLALGCLTLSAGCSGAGVDANSGGEEERSQSGRLTTLQDKAGTAALVGTADADNLHGGDGDDVVRGMGGDDEVYGEEGKDRLYGGPGNDVIDAQDPGSVGEAGRDEISCGPGRDEVLMDANDDEKPLDCEMAGVGSS